MCQWHWAAWSAVDWVNPVNGAPRTHWSATQGRGPSSHVGRRRRRELRRPKPRRRVAGVVRKIATGGRFVRGYPRSNGRTLARRTVGVAWPETAEDGGGERRSGRRSSGVNGSRARGYGEARARARWAPGSTRSSTVASGIGDTDHNDGQKIVGGEQSTDVTDN